MLLFNLESQHRYFVKKPPKRSHSTQHGLQQIVAPKSNVTVETRRPLKYEINHCCTRMPNLISQSKARLLLYN